MTDLIDFILALCKVTIYRTYMNSIKVSSNTSLYYVSISQRDRILEEHCIKCIDGRKGDTFNEFWRPLTAMEADSIVYHISQREGYRMLVERIAPQACLKGGSNPPGGGVPTTAYLQTKPKHIFVKCHFMRSPIICDDQN